MGRFIADEPLDAVPEQARDNKAAVPLAYPKRGAVVKAVPPSAAAPRGHAVEAAMKVFLGVLREQEGRNVKLYKDLSPTDKRKLTKALGEAIRAYLRVSTKGVD